MLSFNNRADKRGKRLRDDVHLRFSVVALTTLTVERLAGGVVKGPPAGLRSLDHHGRFCMSAPQRSSERHDHGVTQTIVEQTPARAKDGRRRLRQPGRGDPVDRPDALALPRRFQRAGARGRRTRRAPFAPRRRPRSLRQASCGSRAPVRRAPRLDLQPMGDAGTPPIARGRSPGRDPASRRRMPRRRDAIRFARCPSERLPE